MDSSQIGVGIWILIGVWVGFLVVFFVGIRAIRARSISATVLAPILLIPVTVTLIIIFYPRYPSKEAETETYERINDDRYFFKSTRTYRYIRIAFLVVGGVLTLLAGGVLVWQTCLETVRPQKMQFRRSVPSTLAKMKLSSTTSGTRDRSR